MTESGLFGILTCSECQALWVINEHNHDDELECPRCHTVRSTDRWKRVEHVETRAEAIEARSRMLADRQGCRDQYEECIDSVDHGDRTLNPADVFDNEDKTAFCRDDDHHDDPDGDTDHTNLTTEAGSGPRTEVEVVDRPQLDAPPIDEDVDTGFRWVNPRGQLSLSGIETHDLPPQRSEWLPRLLEDLQPYTARMIQDLSTDRNYSKREYTSFVRTELEPITGLDDANLNYAAEQDARDYLYAITKQALLWTDDDYREGRGFRGEGLIKRIHRTLRTVSTTAGRRSTGGVDALRHSVIGLHSARSPPLVLSFTLDGEKWMDADAATIRKSLQLFAALAEEFDVRVYASPRVRKRIVRLIRKTAETFKDAESDDEEDEVEEGEKVTETQTGTQSGDTEEPPEWIDAFEHLIDAGMSSRGRHSSERDKYSDDHADEAWAFVEEHSEQTGLLTTVAHLDPDGERSVRAIKQDPAIDYSDGSIDVYCSDLEQYGIVTVDRSYPSNHLSLTSLGKAAQEYVTTEGRVVHPDQSRLDGVSNANPSAQRKYSVSRQQTRGGLYGPAERWQAATGDPDSDGEFVEWLGDPNGDRAVDPLLMHRRYEAGNRVKGVNFVDDEILRWGDNNLEVESDGRQVYVSCFDDHLLIITQWGGSFPTLVRNCAALLDPHVLGKVLDIDRCGSQLDNFHDEGEAFTKDLDDVLVRAQQIGWLSEEELSDYTNWRNRYFGVLNVLLTKMSNLDSLESDQREELMKDLHGLLCSLSHLYHAAGIEITSVVRMPDPNNLVRSESNYQEFLNFLRYTVTKQGGYEDSNGLHSIYRMLIEDRPSKLKSRLSYDVDQPTPTATLTMNWQVVGPGVSQMIDDAKHVIEEESTRLRDSVNDGVEEVALLEIPVVQANSHGHTRTLIREIAGEKDFDRNHRADVDRLARVLEATLGTDEWAPSPYLISDTLDALESRDQPWDQLDVQALQNGLGTLPAKRLFPKQKPSVQRMVSELFDANEPLSRQDLINKTSESSYERNHQELKALWIIEETSEGDLFATAEPWWAATTGDREPRHEPHPYGEESEFRRKKDMNRVKPWSVGDILMLIDDGADSAVIPPDQYAEILDQVSPSSFEWRQTLQDLGWEGWTPLFRAYCDQIRSTESFDIDHSTVRIGPSSPATDSHQTTITEVNT